MNTTKKICSVLLAVGLMAALITVPFNATQADPGKRKHEVSLISYEMKLGQTIAFPDGSGWYAESLGLVVNQATCSQGGLQVEKGANLADTIAAHLDAGYRQDGEIYGHLVFIKTK